MYLPRHGLADLRLGTLYLLTNANADGGQDALRLVPRLNFTAAKPHPSCSLTPIYSIHYAHTLTLHGHSSCIVWVFLTRTQFLGRHFTRTEAAWIRGNSGQDISPRLASHQQRSQRRIFVKREREKAVRGDHASKEV